MSEKERGFRCIAVDMGAGSIRVMLGLVRRDEISYQEVHRFETGTVFRNGHDRWEINGFVAGIRSGIGLAIREAGEEVDSIGVDAWGADYVLLDVHGNLAEEPVSYRDHRTAGMHDKWRERMPDIETFRRSGINFYPFNTLFQLLSMQNLGDLPEGTRLLFMPCYISYLLSGSAANELTIASTSQMLGISGTNWDPDILRNVGLKRELLGNVIPPGAKLGKVRLPEGRKISIQTVAVCGHDTAGVVASLPVGKEHFAYISAGTWCILGIESDRPLLSEEAMQLGFTNERGYGNSYRILKNITGLWLLQGLKKGFPERTSFDVLEEMARREGDATQLIDPDDPLFYHPDDMKEAFDTFFRKTRQALPERMGGYLGCAYDSLCFSFRFYLGKLEELTGQNIEVLHVVGGGSQSELLNQRIATLCRREVVSGPVEGATLGNLLVQAKSMGIISSLEEGRRMVKDSFPGKKYIPGPVEEENELRYHRFLILKHGKTL